MSKQEKQSRAVQQFYTLLDKDTQDNLTQEQKEAIEQALNTVSLVNRQPVDIRKSFPFFGKRYFFVFLAGKDRRRLPRDKFSLSEYLVLVMVVLLILSMASLSVLALYLLKSAVGIDIFQDYSFGIWDWFKSL